MLLCLSLTRSTVTFKTITYLCTFTWMMCERVLLMEIHWLSHHFVAVFYHSIILCFNKLQMTSLVLSSTILYPFGFNTTTIFYSIFFFDGMWPSSLKLISCSAEDVNPLSNAIFLWPMQSFYSLFFWHNM